MVDFYKKYKFCLLLPKAMIKFWHKIPIERETEMKKIIALLVACVLLAGCGQADKKIPEDMSDCLLYTSFSTRIYRMNPHPVSSEVPAYTVPLSIQ